MLLLFHFLHLLGLLLHLFEALLEAALFLGFARGILRIGSHAGTHFLLARELADENHGGHGEGQRNQIVEVQTCTLAVEDEEHHEGHEIHHELHAGHRLCAGLLLHGVPSVEELHAEHHQAEERHMVTVERNVKPEVEHRVVGRQVIAPEEAFLSQFDSLGEEHEHGGEEGHLQQDR